MFFVNAPEGKARMLMAPGGKFISELVNWKNYFIVAESKRINGKLYQEGDIVERNGHLEYELEKKDISPLFGSYFLKIPGWHSVYSYKLEWSKHHYRGRPGEERNLEETKENLDYIDLKDQYFRSYITKTTGAPRFRQLESDKGEVSSNRVDVSLEYLVVLRVVNPYRFIFDSPENSYDGLLEVMDNLIGNIISQCQFNLTERLQGSREAIWHGLRNPDKIDYEKEYPDLEISEREEVKNRDESLWEQYAGDISNSDQIKILFKGLKDSEEIRKKFPGWGIEISRVEIIEIQPPEEIKKERQKLIQADMEYELKKRERDMSEIEAETVKIMAEATGDKYLKEMNSVNEMVELFMKREGCSESEARKTAAEMFHTIIAGEKGLLEKRIFEGLDGNSFAGLAAQFGIGVGMAREMFGGKREDSAQTGSTGSEKKNFVLKDPRTGEVLRKI